MLLILTGPLWFGSGDGSATPGGARGGGASAVPREREPAVAGQFYPGNRAQLEAAIDADLARAKAPLGPRPIALVAPHAGYVFCGGILGEAWRQAKPHRYDLIVLLGTNHSDPGFEGVSVWNGGSWRTPLGAAAVDGRAAAALLAADAQDCAARPATHRGEHSVEVQVPWAQRLFPGVPILPVVVASEDAAMCERFGRALAAAVRGRQALIVASSDLSHYPTQADARVVDRATLEAVAAMDPAALQRTITAQMRRGVPGLATCACGEAPILAAMAAARELGATRGTAIAYANSGDVPEGGAGRVVGYGAVAFTSEEKSRPAKAAGAEKTAGAATAAAKAAVKPVPAGALSAADRQTLLARARSAIRGYFAGGAPPGEGDCGAALQVKRGAFVTLEEGGELRGCIGHMSEDTPLCRIVGEMAVEAAFGDPRFPALRREELDRCTIEISVLTPMHRVGGPADIRVGRDGVLLRKAGQSAVFLPQVATEQGWDRDMLLTQLARKAGLPPDAWRSGAELSTFQAEVFGEAEHR